MKTNQAFYGWLILILLSSCNRFLLTNTLEKEATIPFTYSESCNCFKRFVALGSETMSVTLNLKEEYLEGIVFDSLGEPVHYAIIFLVLQKSTEVILVQKICETDEKGKFRFKLDENSKGYIFYGLGFQPLLIEVSR